MGKTYKRRNLGKRKKRRLTRKQRGGVSLPSWMRNPRKAWRERQERLAAERADRMAGLQSGDISLRDRASGALRRGLTSVRGMGSGAYQAIAESVFARVWGELMKKLPGLNLNSVASNLGQEIRFRQKKLTGNIPPPSEPFIPGPPEQSFDLREDGPPLLPTNPAYGANVVSPPPRKHHKYENVDGGRRRRRRRKSRRKKRKKSRKRRRRRSRRR